MAMATAAIANSENTTRIDSRESVSVTKRIVNCVLSSRSLSYSRLCLRSLARSSAEPLRLRLITDSSDDRDHLDRALRDTVEHHGHELSIAIKAEVDARAAAQWANYPGLRRFRDGHPCWRKITDPELFAEPGDEVVTIDPDVYFPNRFRFEDTAAMGLMLMWQRPNCLLPEALVASAFASDIPLADHTDIGVCQYRAPLPLATLEQLLVTLPTAAYGPSMHVESIVWAALAMTMGGGYLDPLAWHCFQNTVVGRLARKAGRDPIAALQQLDFSPIKAFHAGGVAKHWLPEAERRGLFITRLASRPSPAGDLTPFLRYSEAKFTRKLAIQRIAQRLGAYRLLAS